ncbi:CHC2 zinc finger [Cyclobacterium lianum]|uniref:CHC2 zinc finger n=1 Tax=Cyclobacterium lianum TaxID=388280 RepID=A0A1M7MBQ3_9BACT|nr:CHC2 zinc finger [Cyclobacterium lianum]
MEIQEIKARLTLAEVLAHYRLKPDKHGRLNCPFHDDRTPSLQVYTKTHTAYCFSSNCKTHGKSMDVINFIMHKENSSKAEAIEKAVELSGGENNPSNNSNKTVSPAVKPTVSREQILDKTGNKALVPIHFIPGGTNTRGWKYRNSVVSEALSRKTVA